MSLKIIPHFILTGHLLNSDIPFLLIDQNDQLEDAISQLRNAEKLAIDTEFQRERTFHPIPALVQIGDGHKNYLFDAVRCDLSPLGKFLSESEQQKIVHSGSQDMEIFHIITQGKPIRHIVDTQIAAQFLNMNDCMGLANLISEVLRTEINKTETVSDWIRRPLSENQLCYAAEDVLFLHRLYAQLEKQLAKDGKLEYFLEECEHLSDSKNAVESLFEKHVKSSDSERFRAIFKDLLEWRENLAIHKNLPRSWILKEIQLKKIAKSEIPSSWIHPELLSEKQFQSYSQVFIQIHERHQSINNRRINTSQSSALAFERLSGMIKARILRLAQRLNIPAEMVCNQRQLKAKTLKMIADKQFEPFEGWRGKMLNESLQQVFLQYLKNSDQNADVSN